MGFSFIDSGPGSLSFDMGTLDKVDIVSPKSQPQRGGPKKSGVWEHFTIKNVGGDRYRACCNKCDKSFAYSTGPKLSGTSHLKRHVDMGICHVNGVQDNNVPDSLELKNGTAPDLPKKRQRGGVYGVMANPFSQKRCNSEIARMIILHDYPLDMVDQPGFIEFVRTLQPEFEAVSSVAIYDECMDIYSTEKTNLANLLSSIPGRVSLSLSLWTSDETMGYAVLSGHFIDSDWTLHRRLLNVVMVPDPESEAAFSNAILSCLSGWGLERKRFALTLDRSFASEATIENLRNIFLIKNPHMLNGQFVIPSCYAQILSSLAFDSINAMSDTVQKVRNCVKYVKTSELNEEKFTEIKLQLQVPSKKNLVLDNCTRWDSTYHMLSAASELKEVFIVLEPFDHAYGDVILKDEWRRIETLVDYLQRFYDAANVLTTQKYPTADWFFIEVCSIQRKLSNSAASEDPFVNNLIQPLLEKWEIYWRDCGFVLAMAVVMNPRYKMKLVRHFFSQLYGQELESCLRAVEEGVRSLYVDYVKAQQERLFFSIDELHIEELKDLELCIPEMSSDHHTKSDLDRYLEDPRHIIEEEMSSDHHTKSDLDRYLEDPRLIIEEGEGFEVLDWWKVYKCQYPTLANMAADLLSMPVATVPHNCVFDTVSKKVDSFRGSLKPASIEAFACAKDWLQSGMQHPATIKMGS